MTPKSGPVFDLFAIENASPAAEQVAEAEVDPSDFLPGRLIPAMLVD